MNQRYAMVIQSNRIEVDRSLNVDFVFSENAFKFRLHLDSHPLEVFVKPKRNSDSVARKAIRSQLYIDSQRESIGASFIEKINDIKE